VGSLSTVFERQMIWPIKDVGFYNYQDRDSILSRNVQREEEKLPPHCLVVQKTFYLRNGLAFLQRAEKMN